VNSQYIDADGTFLGRCVAGADCVADVLVRGVYGLVPDALFANWYVTTSILLLSVIVLQVSMELSHWRHDVYACSEL